MLQLLWWHVMLHQVHARLMPYWLCAQVWGLVRAGYWRARGCGEWDDYCKYSGACAEAPAAAGFASTVTFLAGQSICLSSGIDSLIMY